MNGYKVTIAETSREFTKKELIAMKDTSDAQRLDDLTASGPVIISPEAYAVLNVHNEKSANKDYEVYLVIDTTGQKYVTGSAAFFTTFRDIFADMEGEPFDLKIYRKPSKNYTGKEFITCSVVL